MLFRAFPRCSLQAQKSKSLVARNPTSLKALSHRLSTSCRATRRSWRHPFVRFTSHQQSKLMFKTESRPSVFLCPCRCLRNSKSWLRSDLLSRSLRRSSAERLLLFLLNAESCAAKHAVAVGTRRSAQWGMTRAHRSSSTTYDFD